MKKHIIYAIVIAALLVVSSVKIMHSAMTQSKASAHQVVRNEWGQRPEDARKAYKWLMAW